MRQVRSVLADLHETVTGDPMASLTARQHVENWLSDKRQATAAATINFYSQSLAQFLTHLGPVADSDIAEVTKAHVLAYRNSMAGKVAPKTAAHHLQTVKSLFKAARREGLIADDPAEFVEKPRMASERARRPFTVDELRAVLALADDEWRSMILFALYTGQRLGDVGRLRWSNVDTVNGELRLTTGKTGRRIIIPLAEPLQRHVATLPVSGKGDGPLHPRAFAVLSSGKASGALSNQFSSLLAEAGLREPVSHRSKDIGRGAVREASTLSFHSLRHTAVTMMKEAGIPAAVVMELVGHESAEVSQNYTHIGKDALAKAAASLPDLVAAKGKREAQK